MYRKETAHYSRRKLDGKFEVIAECTLEDHGWITLDVVDSHDEAVKAIHRVKKG